MTLTANTWKRKEPLPPQKDHQEDADKETLPVPTAPTSPRKFENVQVMPPVSTAFQADRVLAEVKEVGKCLQDIRNDTQEFMRGTQATLKESSDFQKESRRIYQREGSEDALLHLFGIISELRTRLNSINGLSRDVESRVKTAERSIELINKELEDTE